MAISADGKTRAFKVVVPNIPGVSEADWREYIADAVGSWKGQFHQDDPLFDLDGDYVRVTRLQSNSRNP